MFSPDSQTRITAHLDLGIRVWSLATRQQLAKLTNNPTYLAGVALSPDGKTLATGDWGGQIRILDLGQRHQVAVLTNHTRPIFGVAFSPDGKTLASASADCSIRLWDTRTWQEVSTLRGSQDEVDGIVFTSDGKTLFSGTKDGKILAWDGRPRPRRAEVLRRPSDAVEFRLLLPSGTPFCLHSNRTFNFWEPKTLRKLAEQPVMESEPWTNYSWIAFSPGMERIAMATHSQRIYLLDGEGNRPMPLAGLPFAAQVGQFPPDGKLLFAVSATYQELRVWDVERLEILSTLLKANTFPSCGLCFTTSAQMVAVGNNDGTIEVWDLARKERVAGWQAPARNGFFGMAFMPGGKRLVTVGWDNKARLWDVESQHEVVSLGRTLNAYCSLAVSPDGGRIAAGTWDGLIRIWNVATGQELVTLRGVIDWADPDLPDRWKLGRIFGLAFQPPDGDTLISGTDSEARLWRAPSWAEIDAAEKQTEGQRW